MTSPQTEYEKELEPRISQHLTAAMGRREAAPPDTPQPTPDPRPWPTLQSLLPTHSESELKALEKSITAHGVLENGVYWVDEEANHWILDGAHRIELSGGEMTWRQCSVPPGNLDEALALGLALNLAKRNPSPEQLRDTWDQLQARRTVRRLTALKLRGEGKTQAEAASLVGVTDRTIANWEQNTSNRKFSDACSPKAPDLRSSVPKTEYQKIYVRHMEGAPQARIAADARVMEVVLGAYRFPPLKLKEMR